MCTSHVYKAVKRVMLRPESNNFALAVQLPAGRAVIKKDLFHFGSSHHLETMKYEKRNKILSLKRLNYPKRDGSRVCIQLQVTNCMPCQTAVQKEEILFFLSTVIESVTYRNIFWSRPKSI